MKTLMEAADLPGDDRSRSFVGADHGDIPVTFILVRFPPGVGPELHRHPYAEVFVIEAGEATFRVGDAEIVARAGQIAIAPPNTFHGFTNTGDGELRLTAIHPASQFSTEWLKEAQASAASTIDGKIEQRDERVTFRYERRLRHPVDVVWRAITDPDKIEAWFGGRVEMELKPGGQYISHHRGGQRVVDRIERLKPPTLLEHTFWVEVNPSALVTWELRSIDEGCLLTLTHSLAMEDIRTAAATIAQGDDPSIILSRNAAGWHHILDKLTGALEGRSLEWSEGAQQALQRRYAAMLV